jgi:hypothetical protein
MAHNGESTGRKGAGTYQMLWDCKFCGTEKLLGVTHRHCPICGAPQDPERRYFPAEADLIALEDHQFVGADKLCPACEQPNSAASAFCAECGANLATGETVDTFGVRDIGTGIAESDTQRDVVKEEFDAEMARVAAEAANRPILLGLRKQQLIIGGVLALAVIIIAGIVFALTYREQKSGTVSALTWQRTIEIDAFRQISESDWDDHVPGDAYSESCQRRQRGTEKVQVGSHEECRDVDQGDGSMRRECRNVPDYEERPVYDDWCSYKVDRWVKARDVEASGRAKIDPPPAWPAYTLAGGRGSRNYGQERAGDRHETYRVVLDLDGDSETCTFDQAKWETFTVGMRIEVEVGLAGNPACDTLTVAE